MSRETNSEYRVERDTMGAVEVPAGKLWGAQTQRALGHFGYGTECMPVEVVHALGRIKVAAVRANRELGLVPSKVADLVERAALEVAAGELDAHFPLMVWQSGSGTQTNMNVNEVVANRAAQLAGAELGQKDPVHPNDHVNRCQSTNDAFPTALHMAVVDLAADGLLPALDALAAVFEAKAERYAGLVKTGRTHLQDAVPLTLGQEMGAWAEQICAAADALRVAVDALYAVPLGGTAVGTGLGSHPRFAALAVRQLAELSGRPYRPADNRFARLAAHDDVVAVSGAVRRVAVALTKVANDVRWLGAGPRCGIGELRLPANEPGSSIMPGKVNPSQCEALTMACAYVMGLDAATAYAGAQGNFQLNVYKPVMAHCLLASLRVLSGATGAFTVHCAEGLEADEERIGSMVGRSLMLVTALAPAVGYDRAAEVAHLAHKRGSTLREACLELGYLDGEAFDRLVDPAQMTAPRE